MFFTLLADIEIPNGAGGSAQGLNLGTFQGVGNYIPSEIGGTASACNQVELFITALFGFLTIIAGLAFLIYFILGALNWITAGGDKDKVDRAKKYMTNGAVGMIVVVAAYSIVWIVGAVLGIDILNPVAELSKIIACSP